MDSRTILMHIPSELIKEPPLMPSNGQYDNENESDLLGASLSWGRPQPRSGGF